MCVLTFKSKDKAAFDRKSEGFAMESILKEACMDNRLICGLLPSIARMEQSAEDVELCILVTTRPRDVVTHMQSVLLRAFCVENQIPVIEMEDCTELRAYCGSEAKDRCVCAIVTTNTREERILSYQQPAVEVPR